MVDRVPICLNLLFLAGREDPTVYQTYGASVGTIKSGWTPASGAWAAIGDAMGGFGSRDDGGGEGAVDCGALWDGVSGNTSGADGGADIYVPSSPVRNLWL